MNNKNLLNYVNREEYLKYLRTLEEDELLKEFNKADNLIKEVYYEFREIVNRFNLEYRIKVLDDIHHQTIKDYKEYINNYLNNLIVFLEQDYFSKIQSILNYVNEDKLMVNSYSYLISCENKSVEEVILYIYDMIKSELGMGIYDRFKYLYGELKRIYNSYLFNYGINDSMTDLNSLNLFFFDIRPGKYNQKALEYLVKTLTDLIEYISYEKVDYQGIFGEYIDKYNYDILRKYNCLNKLSLLLKETLVGIDFIDIVSCFENQKIKKIIDGNEEINLEEANDITTILYIKFFKEDLELNSIWEDIEKLRGKYNCSDVITGVRTGEPKDFLLLIGK